MNRWMFLTGRAERSTARRILRHLLGASAFCAFSTAAFGQCAFTVSPAAQAWVDSLGSIDQSGDPLVIHITASTQTCVWTADASDEFAVVSGSNTGTGDGTVTYSIPPNISGSAQSTTLHIAGNAVNLTQDATPVTFADVLPGQFNQQFFDGINLLRANKITSGCLASPLSYCPSAPVTRDLMAVFIVRMIMGGGPGADNFSYTTTPYFTDVPPNSQYFKWIQKLKDLGITSGTTATTYSPQAEVTRGQMAVFIVRARLGATTTFSYNPTPYFTDVPTSYSFFKWIQKLKEIGITAGTTATTFSPDLVVTRDQMAVFLVRAGFNDLLNPAAPLITTVLPNHGAPGSSVSVGITAVNSHFGSDTTVLAENGVTAGTPTITDATHLSVVLTIPSGTPAGEISLTAQTPSASEEEATIPNGFTVGTADSTPSVTNFSPQSGSIGALVAIEGANFGAAPQLSMPAAGGGSVALPVQSFTASSASVLIPSGAATGPITVSNIAGSAASATPFTVTPVTTFSILAAPASASLIQGQSVTYAVQLTSPNGFNQIAPLSVTGLPDGVTASFSPPGLTAGQTSILTLTAPSSQPLSTASLSVSAAATVNGLTLNPSAAVSVTVTAVTTSFKGRAVGADPQETPLAGVTVTMLGLDGSGNTTDCHASTVSDAAGNFALTGLPQECIGPQLVGFGGTKVSSPPGTYAGVNLVFTLVSGQVVVSPVLVHLPLITTAETFMVQQNASTNQSYSFTSVPGLSVTVYAHTTFTEADGTQPNPFPLAGVQVPVDRLPDVMPTTSAGVSAFIVAFQPANTTASQGVAVSFPNSLNVAPGTDMPLMTLNPTLGRMAPYGTGVVSSDGTTIVPDIDPSTGSAQHRYGIVHFDWHGPEAPPSGVTNPGPNGGGAGSSCSMPGGCPAGNTNGNGNGGGDGGDCHCCKLPPPGARQASLDAPVSPDDNKTLLADSRIGANRESPPFADKPAEIGDPVDLFSGLQVISNTDIAFGGARGSVALVRNYRSLSTNAGPFGIGTGHNYGLQLNISGRVRNGQGVIFLVMPDGNQYPFSLTPSGTFVNSTLPEFAGAVFSNPSTGVYNLRYRNGLTYGFQTSSQGGLLAYLTSITDPNGNVTTLTLNPSQPLQITEITDPVGRSLTLSYDSANRITSATDPIGRIVHYAYNSQGTLATFTDTNGGITTYGYDSANNMIQITDPRGVVQMQNTLDANGRVIQQVAGDGGVLNFVYTVINPLAVVPVTFAANVKISVVSSPMLTTQVTDSLGVSATYRFNVNGFVTDIVNSQGQTEHFTLQNGTNLRLSDTFGSATSSWTYDANGNILTATDPTGLTTRYAYDPVFNNVTLITDPLGNITTFAYDAHGNLLTATDANGNVTSYQYSSTGLLTKATDALSQSATVAYDGAANPISVTDPLGNMTKLFYDGISRPTVITDALGRKTSLAWDALNRPLTLTNPAGGVTTATYDGDSNLVSLQDARGNTNSFAWDPMNRLVSRTDGLGNSDARTWDTDGNLIKYVDRRGQTSTFAYDNLNRLVKETYPDATVTRNYDLYGRLVQAADSAGGVFTYSYDLAWRLLGSVTPYGAIGYAYDGRGLMASRKVAGQGVLKYGYDPVGNLISTALPSASASFTYTPRNQLAAVGRNNGVGSSYSYDGDGRLLSIVHTNGGTTIASDTYGYDAVGNRLTHSTSAGQALTTPATTNSFNAANQLTNFGSAANTFDPNGNLAQEGTATTYTWDSRNRLKSITTAAGQTTNFSYDFLGNLLQQADSGPALNLTKSFVLDDLTDVAYETASDGTSYSVLAGRSIDSDLGVAQSNGEIFFGLTDGLNSTVATVDQTGAQQAQFMYEPFGQTTTTGSYPFQFTGRTPISASLYYYRARPYSPLTGRFLSEDPMGGLMSLYAYGRDNPIRHRDPRGTCDTSDASDPNAETAKEAAKDVAEGAAAEAAQDGAEGVAAGAVSAAAEGEPQWTGIWLIFQYFKWGTQVVSTRQKFPGQK